jgi:hypothetical protein
VPLTTSNFDIQGYELVGSQVLYVHGLVFPIQSGSITGTSSKAQTIIVNTSGFSNDLRVYPVPHMGTSHIVYTDQIVQVGTPQEWHSVSLLDRPSRFWNCSIESFIFPLADTSRSWNAIRLPARLADYSDAQAVAWFASESELIDSVSNLCNAVDSELRTRKLRFSNSITTFSDPEEDDDNSLIVEYKIANKHYDEVIKIWNAISLKVLTGLPENVLDKVTLTMEDE